MKKLKHLVAAGALITAMSANAVPAKRLTFTATQPDGTEVTLTRAGDEFFKFFLTEDGRMVLGNEVNGYYFAEVDANTGLAKASNIKAANVAARTDAEKEFLASINREKLAEAGALTAEMSPLNRRSEPRSLAPRANASVSSIPQSGVGLSANSAYPRTGSPKGLIILVEYTDVKFKTSYSGGASAYFERMINQKGFSENGGTGSALDWFTDASMGLFTPDFDVYGPVTLPKNQAYYGGNDYFGDDENAPQMIVDGCKGLDSQINFKDYDTDGDGYVDNVFVIYAGQGEASYGGSNCVWPHQWELSSAGKSLTLDGVRINRYACSNEWEYNRPDGIGTFVHEFSHVMGLPDLYHTADQYGTENYTPSSWSVLDYGPYNNDGCTPPTYSIFERNAMGWIDPLVLDKTPRTVSLEHIESSNYGCIIPTAKNTEFFLLENRQQSNWDKYLPGHGMLIWHIDYNASVWSQNAVNNTKSHQYVDIEEANNNPNGTSETAMSGYAFPGTGGRYTSFTDNTTPNMKTWAGVSLGIPLTNITEKNGIITFDVCGGAPVLDSPVAFVPLDTEIGPDYFVASWSSVEGATDYLLTVSTYGEIVEGSNSNDFGSDSSITNAEGWTTSARKSYATTDNYGESIPSLRMESGYWVMTPEYDYPITRISFWAKWMGSSNQDQSSATLFAVKDGVETKLTDFTSWNSQKGATVNYTLNSNDVHQLKLVYNKEKYGNLAIDDFTVYYANEGTAPLAAYNGVSTKGATSMRVENLPADKDKFCYSVVAVDNDGLKSAASNAIDVVLGNSNSGVADIDADDNNAPVEYFNLQGIRVDNPANGIYIRRQGSRVEKVVK